MIKSVHTMFYSSEPEKLRQFIREKLGFSFTDVGGGWLIFNLPKAEMGCHPAENEKGAPSGTHSISFITNDVKKSMKKLQSKGVEFTSDIKDYGYGLVTRFKMPGDFAVDLYQPKYKLKKSKSNTALKTKKAAAKKKKKGRR